TLAEQAGCAVDNGVVVDQSLRTSVPGIWAAGDVARWPDPKTGELRRIEHWVVAQRLGQAAARAIVGRGDSLAGLVPFFWSQHYDLGINYVGHAARWDEVAIAGKPD